MNVAHDFVLKFGFQLSNCQATYMAETSRNLTTQLNKHKRATEKGDLNNNTV